MAAVIVGGAVLMRGRTPAQPSAGTGDQAGISQSGNEPQIVNVAVGDLPPMGDPQAPVAIIEFGDFQCPFCKRFAVTTEQQIKDKYVKTGQAKIIWRDFAFLGEESIQASQAARCANEKGKFWEYHDKLFERQGGENVGVFADDKLASFAVEIGLNKGEFMSCLSSGKYKEVVRRDTVEGQQVGITGTPGFVINGRVIVGALPFQAFEEAIEEALKK